MESEILKVAETEKYLKKITTLHIFFKLEIRESDWFSHCFLFNN